MPEHTHTGRIPKPECDCRECFEERMAAHRNVEIIDAGGSITRDTVRVETDPHPVTLTHAQLLRAI